MIIKIDIVVDSPPGKTRPSTNFKSDSFLTVIDSIFIPLKIWW